MIEIERTFLINTLPVGLEECPKKDIVDHYIDGSEGPQKLRIRKSGDTYELTRKRQLDEHDATQHEEINIPLSEGEYVSLMLSAGKGIEKTRYYYPYSDTTIEIDVFRGRLAGFMYAEVEFENEEEMNTFEKPDFLGRDVSQDDFVASDYLKNIGFKELQEKYLNP